jgi:3-deoxy-manno-octulosonate cytidylyltransferase (CMP-KDO synthetase)
VIPARISSERLPGKPLADIAGMTMIERVYRQALASSAAEVMVATDSKKIAEVCLGAGARVEMTAADHASGTDRIAEVARRLQWPSNHIVVNVQGDEPMIPPVLIDQVAELLDADSSAAIATLMTPLAHDTEYHDPNMVKVVTDSGGAAVYFSRAPIPWRVAGGVPPDARRHVGIYAYRVGALLGIAAAPVAPPESSERLEQLRAIWMGLRITIADAVAEPPRGVDTDQDLEVIRKLVTAGTEEA